MNIHLKVLYFTYFILFGAKTVVHAQSNVKVAAYYYPWHSNNFHNRQGYVRKILKQTPTLGEYDDQDPRVIRQHMAWSEQANIDVWITSWFGPKSQTDSTLQSSVLPTISGSDLKFAVFYETVNRLNTNRNTTLVNVVSDINYICDNYLNHSNYYRISDKPVLVVYLTRVLEKLGVLEETVLLMRTAARDKGIDLYLVGDHAFGNAPSAAAPYFSYLNAITNYDVYGGLGRFYVGATRLEAFYKQQAEWKARAAQQGCHFMPGISPGFNDRGVRLEVNHEPLSRKLTADSEFGTLFQASIRHAMKQVDPNADNLIIVTSFNEWHEDTQIEPVQGVLTKEPYEYTLGLEYDGYGTLYLDSLRAVTTGDSFAPSPRPTSGKPSPAPTLPPSRLPTPLPTTRKPTPLPTTRKPTPLPTTRKPTLLPTTQKPTEVPTLIPTSEPTQQLTMAPSFTATQPSPQPTLGTASPSIVTPFSTTLPSLSTTMPMITTAPSQAPSLLPPAWIDPTPDRCDDSLFGSFPTREWGDKTCIWLAARPTEQAIYCRANETGYHVCEETCGKCQDTCFDTKEKFTYKGISRNCLWLSLRPHIQKFVCLPGNVAYDQTCPETCNACDGPTTATKSFRFQTRKKLKNPNQPRPKRNRIP
jgi:glycoprotein endo-alpha-1,2-mannosidase